MSEQQINLPLSENQTELQYQNLSEGNVLRFWKHVDKTPGQGPQGQCWTWKAYVGRYGSFMVFEHGRKRTTAAHRVSFAIVNGGVPFGLSVLHRCDNPPCVNPDHLFLGTQADNMRDKALKGRTSRPSGNDWIRKLFDRLPRGEQWWTDARKKLVAAGRPENRKLTEEQVEEMIRLIADKQINRLQASRRFGIGYTSVNKILDGRTYKSVTTRLKEEGLNWPYHQKQ